MFPIIHNSVRFFINLSFQRGHFVVVRCQTDEDFSRWKRSLESQTIDYYKMNYVKPVLYSQPSTEKVNTILHSQLYLLHNY